MGGGELASWLRRLPSYLYLVDLIEGRRVLEVGCGTGYGARFLANRGAAQVVGIDRSLRRITEARHRYRQTNLEYRCEDPSSIELEDESFDCIFVPEGVDVLRRRSVLAELRRLLARNGNLIVCGVSSDRRGVTGGASYYEFRDRLERLFAPIRMIAQAPVTGFSLVEYGDEDEAVEVSVDTSLVELQGGVVEPTDYVALCGGQLGPLRGLTVVQMPDRAGTRTLTEAVGLDLSETDSDHADPMQPPSDAIVARELRLRLETAIEDRARALAEVSELRALVEQLQREGAVIDSTEPSVSAPLDPVAPAIEVDWQDAARQYREVIASLEGAVEEGRAYADELAAQLGDSEARVAESRRMQRDATERIDRLETELRHWRSHASQLEGRLMRLTRMSNGSSAGSDPRIEALQSDLHRLEQERQREKAALKAAAVEATAALAEAEAENQRLAAQLSTSQAQLGTTQASAALAEIRVGGQTGRRLSRLEHDVDEGHDLLRHIEEGLAALEQEAARVSGERPASAWAAHKDEQVRELSAELGVKDAEITILHVGVSALRARLRELVAEVRSWASSVRGRSNSEVQELVDRLEERLVAFEERE